MGDMVVVEARERVGGRAYDVTDPAIGLIEIGGQWVGPTQHRFHAVLEELDIATYPTCDTGDGVLIFGDGAPSRYSDDTFGLDRLSLAQVGIAHKRLNRLIDGFDVDEPWTHPDASALDGQTRPSKRGFDTGARLDAPETSGD